MPGLRDRVVSDYEAIVIRNSRQVALTMAKAAAEAKAEDMVILDLRKLSYNFDYFFLCSASSDRRIQTVASRISEALSKSGKDPAHQEGRADGGWLLLDFGSVVGHVFSPEARGFYQLERLWADAPRVRVK